MDLMTATPKNIRRRLARTPVARPGGPRRAARRVPLAEVKAVLRKRSNETRHAAVMNFVNSHEMMDQDVRSSTMVVAGRVLPKTSG